MVRKCSLSLPNGHSYPRDAYAWDIADVLCGPDIVPADEMVETETEEQPTPKPRKRKEIKQQQKREVKQPKKLNIGKKL